MLQLASPLRLQTDSIYLHSIAIGLLENREPELSVQFWPGFPCILAFLEAIGLGTSAGFIGLNLLCISVGLTAAWYLIAADDSDSMAWASIMASLGSWLLIKFCTIALTDIPCMAFSMLALHYCTRATKGSRRSAVADLMAAVLCTAAACSIRPNAIALLPAIGVATLSTPQFRDIQARLQSANSMVATGIGATTLLVGLVTAATLLGSRYGRELLTSLGSEGVYNFLLSTISLRSLDCAETLINIPMRFLPDSASTLLVLLGGIAFLWLFVSAGSRIRRLLPSDAYLLAFLAILAVWPYRDPRFLIPALPLVFRGWFLALSRCPRLAINYYAVVFIAGTAAALIYSSAITLSGSTFASRYSRELANSYRLTASQALVDSDPPPLPTAVAMIRRYGDSRINSSASPPRPSRPDKDSLER